MHFFKEIIFAIATKEKKIDLIIATTLNENWHFLKIFVCSHFILYIRIFY